MAEKQTVNLGQNYGLNTPKELEFARLIDKMAKEKRNKNSIDDLVGISDLIEKGRFESALSVMDYKGIVERDALYAGIALSLAKELDIVENDKISRPNETSMILKLMDYCEQKSKYLKGTNGGQ